MNIKNNNIMINIFVWLLNGSEMEVFNFEYCLYICKVKYEWLLYDYMYLICVE